MAGLEREQQFKKVEFTDQDIVRFLKTLWIRAKDIPCEPRVRIAFHNIILIQGIGGFRPYSVIYLTYGQFKLGTIRDPTNPGRTRFVVEPTVRHDKVKRKKIRKTQDEIYIFCQPSTP